MGIEPTSKAWEAFILPMNYARMDENYYSRILFLCKEKSCFFPQTQDLFHKCYPQLWITFGA